MIKRRIDKIKVKKMIFIPDEYKKANVENIIFELEAELFLNKTALEVMKINKTNEVDSKEVKAYIVVKTLDDQVLSQIQKAKIISNLIK